MFIGRELDEIVRLEALKLEDSLSFTNSDIKMVKDLYTSLMKEDRNKDYNQQEQITLIGTLIEETEMYKVSNKYSKKQSFRRIFNEHGDNSHLSYFDNFLEEGESVKIIKSLTKIGKSSNVLRGIKKLQDYDANIDGVSIHQKVGTNELGSRYIEEFSISYKGRTIYEFTGYEEYEIESYGDQFGDIGENLIALKLDELLGSEYTRKKLDQVTFVNKDSVEKIYFFVNKSGEIYTRKTINGKWSK